MYKKSIAVIFTLFILLQPLFVPIDELGSRAANEADGRSTAPDMMVVEIILPNFHFLVHVMLQYQLSTYAHIYTQRR